MVYHINKPLATDKISASQADLLDNTNQANASFGIDHLPLTDISANLGFHKALHMIVGAAPTTAAGYGGLYFKNIPTLGGDVLCVKSTDDVEHPITGRYTIGASAYEFPLFGGITVKSGFQATLLNSTVHTFTFAGLGLSNLNSGVLYMGVNFYNQTPPLGGSCSITKIGTTGFSLYWKTTGGTLTANLSWIIIGQ
jgi:hypothetical protein